MKDEHFISRKVRVERTVPAPRQPEPVHVEGMGRLWDLLREERELTRKLELACLAEAQRDKVVLPPTCGPSLTPRTVGNVRPRTEAVQIKGSRTASL